VPLVRLFNKRKRCKQNVNIYKGCKHILIMTKINEEIEKMRNRTLEEVEAQIQRIRANSQIKGKVQAIDALQEWINDSFYEGL
jgi:hypothetical protein